MIANPEVIDQANLLIWTIHNLERLADRVINICERTIFITTGDIFELDKEYRLFTDDEEDEDEEEEDDLNLKQMNSVKSLKSLSKTSDQLFCPSHQSGPGHIIPMDRQQSCKQVSLVNFQVLVWVRCIVPFSNRLPHHPESGKCLNNYAILLYNESNSYTIKSSIYIQESENPYLAWRKT